MTQDELNELVRTEQDTLTYGDVEFIAYLEGLDLQEALDKA
jgi:hypothetical protein